VKLILEFLSGKRWQEGDNRAISQPCINFGLLFLTKSLPKSEVISFGLNLTVYQKESARKPGRQDIELVFNSPELRGIPAFFP